MPPFPAYVTMPEDRPGLELGHFFGAMRVDAFRPEEEFRSRMDHWIRRFRSAQTVDGESSILIPGDPERECEEARKRDGIKLLESGKQDLREVGLRFEIAW